MVYLCQFPDIYRSLRHFWEIVIAFEIKQEIVVQNLDISLHEVVGATIITYFNLSLFRANAFSPPSIMLV